RNNHRADAGRRQRIRLRRLQPMNRFTIALFTIALATPIHAQETRGIAAPESSKGTVFKGKAPVASELLKVRFPRPKEFKLPNGARVFVLEDHRLPTVRISLSMKAGTLFGAKPGVAEFTASMMDE